MNSGEENPREVKLSELKLNENNIESIKLMGCKEDLIIENEILKLPIIDEESSFGIVVNFK